MTLHVAYLLLGANIAPFENIVAALRKLREITSLEAISPLWETAAVGSQGPNFLNMVVRVNSVLSADELKFFHLRRIEQELGRVRTADKNAPRTIDIDILMWDSVIFETNLWTQAHILCPLSALLPHLVDPQTGLSLEQLCKVFQRLASVILRNDLDLTEFSDDTALT